MYALYHSPFSQHARRVVALLEEAGLPCELRLVSLDTDEHLSETFRRINPNHQVPVLADGDLLLSESNAILRYLCNKHELDRWYPKEPGVRALVDQWLDWNQCRLSPAVVDIVLHKVFLGDRADAAALARGEKKLADVAPVLEAALQKRPYVAGNTPTIADLSIASNLVQLDLAEAVPPTPGITNWFAKVSALEGMRRASGALMAAMSAMSGAAS